MSSTDQSMTQSTASIAQSTAQSMGSVASVVKPFTVVTILEKARNFKEKGNVEFKMAMEAKDEEEKRKYYKAAIAHYSKIPLYTNGICREKINGMDGLEQYCKSGISYTKEEMKEAKDLKIAAYFNCATVHLKLGQLSKAMENVELVLKVDENYKRAIYRRGQIYLEMKELDKATVDLKAAIAAFPTDVNVRKDMAILDDLLRRQEIKHRAALKSAFGGMFKPVAPKVETKTNVIASTSTSSTSTSTSSTSSTSTSSTSSTSTSSTSSTSTSSTSSTSTSSTSSTVTDNINSCITCTSVICNSSPSTDSCSTFSSSTTTSANTDKVQVTPPTSESQMFKGFLADEVAGLRKYGEQAHDILGGDATTKKLIDVVSRDDIKSKIQEYLSS